MSVLFPERVNIIMMSTTNQTADTENSCLRTLFISQGVCDTPEEMNLDKGVSVSPCRRPISIEKCTRARKVSRYRVACQMTKHASGLAGYSR